MQLSNCNICHVTCEMKFFRVPKTTSAVFLKPGYWTKNNHILKMEVWLCLGRVSGTVSVSGCVIVRLHYKLWLDIPQIYIQDNLSLHYCALLLSFFEWCGFSCLSWEILRLSGWMEFTMWLTFIDWWNNLHQGLLTPDSHIGTHTGICLFLLPLEQSETQISQ